MRKHLLQGLVRVWQDEAIGNMRNALWFVLLSYRKTHRKGNFLSIFKDFLGSGARICQLGAWNCLLGAWICLLGAWICLLGAWTCLLGVRTCLLGVLICLLGAGV